MLKSATVYQQTIILNKTVDGYEGMKLEENGLQAIKYYSYNGIF